MYGVAVGEDGTADYRLVGDVALGPADGATQRLALVWRVLDAAGEEVGRLDQANDIPAGSLDGAWGEIAFLIADGIASGVASILERADG
jgi:hypothetical protein